MEDTHLCLVMKVNNSAVALYVNSTLNAQKNDWTTATWSTNQIMAGIYRTSSSSYVLDGAIELIVIFNQSDLVSEAAIDCFIGNPTDG